MSGWASRLTVLGLALLISVTDAAGQRSCDLASSLRASSRETNDARVTYLSAPRWVCTDGTNIEADSAVAFDATSFTQLFGNVVYRDGVRELLADRAQYFTQVGRLQAQGSVRLTNRENGSTVTGEDLVLLEQSDDRPEEDVTVRQGRPHARLFVAASPDSLAVEGPGGVPAPGDPESGAPRAGAPYDVDANLIHLVGDRLFQARGQVEIYHESLQAYGDSVEFQQDVGWLTLFENARVLSEDTVSADTLDLRGDTITMNAPNDQIEEMESYGRAQLLTNDVDMRGPLIRLAFADEELERVFAVQRPSASTEDPEQPVALAEDFRLTGDSIEAVLVDGELDEVITIGAARGVSAGRDSLNTADTPELIRSDWMEGDTITATFKTVPLVSGDPSASPADPTDPGDRADATATERQLDLLVARGAARSFYRSTPDSTAASAEGPPALELNYVIGDAIRLFMKDGEVERMEVDNPTGINLAPVVRAAPDAPPDSLPDGNGGDR